MTETNKLRGSFAKGSLEIINFTIELLYNNKDLNKRISFILVDNAIELVMKTFLEVNRKKVPRDFPSKVKQMTGITKNSIPKEIWGSIEHYHSKRNILYHKGEGLSIKIDLVEEYMIEVIKIISMLFSVNTDNHINKIKSREKLKLLKQISLSIDTIKAGLLPLFRVLGFSYDEFIEYQSQDDVNKIKMLFKKEIINEKFKEELVKVMQIKKSIENKYIDLTIENLTSKLDYCSPIVGKIDLLLKDHNIIEKNLFEKYFS
ncbi:MAG: hypothetical protein ACFFAS_18525 [Promethearchaeota archaeon]